MGYATFSSIPYFDHVRLHTAFNLDDFLLTQPIVS